MATKTRLTAEDFFNLPEVECRRQELVDGEIVEMAFPNAPHGQLISLFSFFLIGHVEKYGGGVVVSNVGFVLNLSYDPERVRGPDVAFVSTERLPEGKLPKKFFRRAPDLAVEILSPSNPSIQIQQKIRDYLEAGARLVWVIAPEARTVTVYRRDGSARFLREPDSLEGEDVLPGLTIPLVKIFR